MFPAKLKTVYDIIFIIILAVLYNLSFSPFDFKFTIYLSLIGYFFLIYNKEKTLAMKYSFIYGFFIYLIGVSWIFNSLYDYGGKNYILSSLMTFIFISLLASFFILIGYIFNKDIRKYQKIILPAYVASLWTIIEILRSNILGGFPWLLVGTSQVNFIYNNIFSLFGTYFISFITVILSIIFFLILYEREKIYYLKYFLSIFLLVIFTNTLVFHKDMNKDKDLRVSIIQPNIKPTYKYNTKNLNEIKNVIYNMSKHSKDSDLIIYPETVIPELYDDKEDTYEKILSQEKKILISGIFRKDTNTNKIFNSMLVIGKKTSIYDKRKLVPFGEFTPFPKLFIPIASMLNIPMSNLSEGDSNSSEIILDKFIIHPLICYESAYPNLISQKDLSKPEVIVVLSNDSWFGQSLAPYQHLQISQTRALEFNKYILRAANTGISAVIDNHGNIKKTVELNQRGHLNEIFRVKTGKTPYSRFGDYPILVLIFAIMISALYLCKKNER